jgi:glycosyltransferase involved in cell wall biosynthesis
MPKLSDKLMFGVLRRLPVPAVRNSLQKTGGKTSAQGDGGGARQLLVDVSVIVKNDARTGIQRVVRAILSQLAAQPPVGYQICPVYATRKQAYRYAPGQFAQTYGLPDCFPADRPVKTGSGDLFLGLDLAAHLLPSHQAELARWKRLGVGIHFIVYDLLPVLYPQWFTPKTTRNFRRWLRTIAIFADSLVCISNTVRGELSVWLRQQYGLDIAALPLGVIPLGADIPSSAPNRGVPEDGGRLLESFAGVPTVLMVGTLEPRKGHGLALAAFEELWRRGCGINLVIVGKPGWKTGALQQTLRTRSKDQERLFWLQDVSDEYLEALYANCTGVLVASEAEGFGLPLIEAMYHNKPVLVRDIPVFREIGGECVSYFCAADTAGFAVAIEDWMRQVDQQPMQDMAMAERVHTWQNCVRQLLLGLQLSPDGAA